MLTLVFICSLLSSFSCQYYVTNYAGNVKALYADGPSTLASFNVPSGVDLDAFGNLFIADGANNLIRKINSTGFVSTVAGNRQARYSDGQNMEASFNFPNAVAVDAFGNIFLSDSGNHMIRMINASGYVSTLAGSGLESIADGQGIEAAFHYPLGLTFDLFGNIFVADSVNNVMRRINSTGYVSTVAGGGRPSFSDGQDLDASLNNPSGVAVDSLGNIFVTDSFNNRIRKINATGYVSTLAGNGSNTFSDGPGTKVGFCNPTAITIDSIGNLYVADTMNHRIVKIDLFGYVSTIAGTGSSGARNGPGLEATFSDVYGITVDGNGTIYVSDSYNQKIRKIYYSESTLSSTLTATGSLTITPSGSSSLGETIISAISPTVTTVIMTINIIYNRLQKARQCQ